MDDQPVDPLADLATVPWHALHHAYGAATDVPDQLRALRSADPDARREALTALFGNVFHQGTRWQASCHVVPFLVALVADPATPDRPAVVDLLHAVALGYRRDDELPFDAERTFADARVLPDEQIAEAVRWLYQPDERADAWPVGSEAVVLRWEADAFDAAAAHLDRYADWLADAEPGVAARAAALLAWFPPTDRTVAGLLAVPGGTDDSVARASANLALAHLRADGAVVAAADAIDTLLRQSLTSPGVDVRVTAAVALAYRLAGQVPAPALDVLVDAVARDRLPPPPPGWDRALRGFVVLALQRLGLG